MAFEISRIMKDYFELRIAYEKINQILYLNGVFSRLEENSIIKVYFVREHKPKIVKIRHEILKLPYCSPKSITLTKFKSRNWCREWKDSIDPIYIDNKIIICPSWKKGHFRNSEDKILIWIDPKMSFGTGQSETTQLMLKMMCRIVDENDRTMLDFGCGTGILAIAGVKLGLKSAIAIDTDEDSITNAKENTRINRVSEKIKLYRCDLRKLTLKNFDIIATNIEFKTIASNLKNIHNKIKTSGKLLISGILKDEKSQMQRLLLKNRFTIIDTAFKAEWLCIYAKMD